MLDETARSCSKRIDVIIPVYNAPVLTRRCIDSVITHLGKSIHRVLIQDDASDSETRAMLDHLPYSCVEVFHAEKNEGFGTAVNTAVSRSDAFYVLILNSDTEVKHNILPSSALLLTQIRSWRPLFPQETVTTISTLAVMHCIPATISAPTIYADMLS